MSLTRPGPSFPGRPGNAHAADPIEWVSSEIQAAACFFPPTDFLNYCGAGKSGVVEGPLASLEVAFGSHGLGPAERTALGRAISPIYFVTARLPPTLIIHGDQDSAVPLQQAESFVKKAADAGASPVKLIIRPGKGHGWGLARLSLRMLLKCSQHAGRNAERKLPRTHEYLPPHGLDQPGFGWLGDRMR
jgi:acetyl esterase/lipase